MVYIICDSTFGIETEYAKKNNIKVVNLKLILDEIVSDEGLPKDWEEFYQRLEKSKSFPTTSQPNPNDFREQIDDVLKSDKDAQIFVFTISEALSGTINSAKLAVGEYGSKNVVAFDSRAASVSGKMLIEEVVHLVKEGKSFDEISLLIPKIIDAIKIEFVPATMEYLKRGGRVGKLSAILASVLQIKPIFEFKNGIVKVLKKTIGIARAVSEMIHSLPQKLKRVCGCYIFRDEHVGLLKSKAKSEKGIENLEIQPVSPVLGCHIGIGTVALASMEEY